MTNTTTTAQLLFVKYRAFGTMSRPVHVALGRHDKTACSVSLKDTGDRTLYGVGAENVTCGKCRAWLAERGQS